MDFGAMEFEMVELLSWFHRYNAWSFTRHRLWNSCKRAYYYRYIGSALRESDDLNINLLKKLKKLNSRNVLKGTIIHDIIEKQITQFHLGQDMNEKEALNEFQLRVNRNQDTAKETLTEYFNGEYVNENFFHKIRTDGMNNIQIFFKIIWPQLKGQQYLRHEKFDKFKIGEREVIQKLDNLSRKKEGIIVISDWKTGADREEYQSDLQIGTYVLWAMQKYRKEPDDIISQLVFLTTGTIRPYNFSMKELEEIRWKIKVDYREMNKSYEIDYFHPEPKSYRCQSCQFATICPARNDTKTIKELECNVDGHLTQKRIDFYY